MIYCLTYFNECLQCLPYSLEIRLKIQSHSSRHVQIMSVYSRFINKVCSALEIVPNWVV